MRTYWSLSYLLGSFFLASCTRQNDRETQTTLTISPIEFDQLTYNTNIQILNIQGHGNIVDFSIASRFPNLETLSILFTPDLTVLPKDFADAQHLKSVELIGTNFTEFPSEVQSLSVEHLSISHNPLLVELPLLLGSIEHLAFANQKSQMEGLKPAYIFNERTDELQHDIDCNERPQFVELRHTANGWRLPTEAEWEIASASNTVAPTEERAWFLDNANGQPHPVSLKSPNNIGLFDMEGNLHEWIWERFGEFEQTNITDPMTYDVPIPSMYTRPIKGGSYNSEQSKLTSYNRPNASPSLRHPSIGFRLVRTVR